MARTGIGFRILSVVVALALMTFAVGFTWAVVDDYNTREIVPKGATVEGVPVGGLTRAEAAALVQERIESVLLAPLTVTFKGKSFQLDTSKYLHVDTAGMVADTFRPKASATMAERVVRRVTGESVPVNVMRKLKVDEAALKGWVGAVAGRVDTRAVDTAVNVVNDRLSFRPSAVGYKLNQVKTYNVIADALMNGERDVDLKIDTIKPAYSEANLGKSILVIKSERHLVLYNGNKIEKEYPVAVGTPGHPTPAGWWVIENKRYMPTWTNPGSGWANGMPSYIAPGYNNPLGTRALDLNASGIRIHGSSNDYSIGTAASHGCMRMHMWDIEDLYDRVAVGTRVVIIP
jgi:lipoprotein-anchoring transpeptidase ErfK/SrfK